MGPGKEVIVLVTVCCQNDNSPRPCGQKTELNANAFDVQNFWTQLQAQSQSRSAVTWLALSDHIPIPTQTQLRRSAVDFLPSSEQRAIWQCRYRFSYCKSGYLKKPVPQREVTGLLVRRDINPYVETGHSVCPIIQDSMILCSGSHPRHSKTSSSRTNTRLSKHSGRM